MFGADKNSATLSLESEGALDVRSFSVQSRMNDLFLVEVTAVSTNPDIDFEAVIGKEGTFGIRTGWGTSSWSGVVSSIHQVRTEADGLTAYSVTVRPRAWLMTERRNYRIFQMKSELDIVQQLLGEWGVETEVLADAGKYKPRKYRVQYDESDFAFVTRTLEDAGIDYFFADRDGKTVMVLDDATTTRDVTKPMLPFEDTPQVTDGEFATAVCVTQRLRPGKMTIGDLDYRKASTSQPRFEASGGLPEEMLLEQFQYEPGAFLFKQDAGGDITPSADDQGPTRTDDGVGASRTAERLQAKRGSGRRVAFESNALDLAPGALVNIVNHPHRALGSKLLVTEVDISGEQDESWRANLGAMVADAPHRPARKTPRPKVKGLESATVVGPGAEDIHTDEYGRVRVQFHWDREGQRNEGSSCWIPTSQPWAGPGFGGVNLPRIGQEVLVAFLGGDPDRPVVVGRVFTDSQKPPYALPQYHTVSGLRSETTPRLVAGAADGGAAGALQTLLGGGTPLSADKLASMVTQPGPFRAASPNSGAHSWRGSELVFEDKAGREIAYLQAQKDFNLVVKNAWTSVVGNHAAHLVGTDELLNVGNKQEINVGSDRAVNVGGKEETTVEGLISMKTETFAAHFAKSFMTVKSDTKIRLECGQSSITLTPDKIVLKSPHVDLNPASTGEDPEVAKAREEEARKAAARQEVLNRWGTALNTTPATPEDAAYRDLVQKRLSNGGLDNPNAFQVNPDPSRQVGVRNFDLGQYPPSVQDAAINRYIADTNTYNANY